MINKALASISYEIGGLVGDTSSDFMTKVKIYLNDRYSDSLMRTQATMWTMASLGALADSGIPTLGLGEVIKAGATADAYDTKRAFTKSAKYEKKYDFMLSNFIIAGDSNRLLASFSRYGYHA